MSALLRDGAPVLDRTLGHTEVARRNAVSAVSAGEYHASVVSGAHLLDRCAG